MTQITASGTLYDLAFPYLISLEQKNKVTILRKTNYTELSMLFAIALDHEAYELCAEIKTILAEREEQFCPVTNKL